MAISKEDILHIANLASLNLSDEEIEKYTADMKEILEFANTINSVDTKNLDETIAAVEKSNAFRKDVVKESLKREELLKNAPSQDEGMYRIPKVIN